VHGLPGYDEACPNRFGDHSGQARVALNTLYVNTG
jgi:hypothetical protein